MKSMLYSLLLTIALLATGLSDAFAQTGEVRYDRTVKFEIKLPPQMAHVESEMPSSRTSKRLLLFNETESVMKDAPPDEADEEDGGDTNVITRGNMHIRMRRTSSNQPEQMFYRSIDSGGTIERKTLLGRTFLITGEEKSFPWRLTGEQGQYKGYQTQKAVATVDSTTIEAWFAPQIPVSLGPGEYGGLPGLILVLNVNDGEEQYMATSIDLESAPSIERPSDGKEVTREEFDQIVEEKRREMRAQGGWQGVFINDN